MGKRGLRFSLRLAFAMGLALVLTAPAAGQLRCDLVPRNKPAAGADSSCLDLLALQSGGSVSAPANATRFAPDGLRLCKNIFVQNSGGVADIVFIYDNSSSMNAGFLWRNPATGDTTFYVWERGCADPTITGQVTYQTQEGPHTVEVLRSGAGCDFYAGDPYKARGAVIRRAIDYVAANAAASTAGGIAFTNVTYFERAPLILTPIANAQTVKNAINIVATIPSSGTFYRPPLDSAKRWLNTPTLRKTLKPAIVFISDGAPGDTDPYLDLVDANMPPIYSIFLGQVATPDTASLRQLSDLTGGRFYRVNPSNVAEINRIMEEILRAILVPDRPSEVTVANNSLAPPQTSRARIVNNPDSSATLLLDSIIALRAGANNIVVSIQGASGPRNFSFTVQADAPAAGGSTPQLRCYPQAALSLRNQSGGVDPNYPGGMTNYDVTLTRSPSELGAVRVAAVSSDAGRPQPFGDAETLVLPLSGQTPAQATNILPAMPFNGAQYAPTTGNGTLESTPRGRVRLTWSHPRDARESAIFELPGPGGSAPTLGLYHAGQALSAVNYDQYDLEIRLAFSPGESCPDCRVRVQPSSGPDRESVAMAPGGGGYHRGVFSRELNTPPVAGDLRLQHGPADSVILTFENTLHPGEIIRRSYPFIPPPVPPDVLIVRLHNNLSREETAPLADKHWLVAAHGGLQGPLLDPKNKCCQVMPWPLSPADSARYLGFTIETSKPFTVESQVFSNLGQFVSEVKFSLNEAEFDRLPRGATDSTRVLKLLWGHRTESGAWAGTGAYVLRAAVSLTPKGQTLRKSHLVGFLRGPAQP